MENAHLVTRLRQVKNDLRADEARAANDQNVHAKMACRSLQSTLPLPHGAVDKIGFYLQQGGCIGELFDDLVKHDVVVGFCFGKIISPLRIAAMLIRC